MAWIDALLLNVLPVFLVLSLLAILTPSLRASGSWRGIGVAWLATFIVALLIAVTHLDDWALDGACLNFFRGGTAPTPTGVTANAIGPCTSANNLPLWLVALPPLIGVAILLAWVWRHTGPLEATLRTVAALTAMAVVIVGLGQVNENAALLSMVAVATAAYAWPRLRRQRAS